MLAIKTGRPVRMAYTREETMDSGSKKHPFIMRYKTGATSDGKLIAIDVDILADAGAYPTNSPNLILSALCISCGPYEVPNARGHSRAILTNNPFTESMRGVGANQVCFAYEAQMDEVAKKLGMDPVEFRRRNFIQKGETLMQKQPMPMRVMLPELLEEVKSRVGRTAGLVPEKGQGPWQRGIGYIGNIGGYGRPRISGESYISLEDDGSVNLRCGASDVGAGQTQAYRQLAAEAVGVSLEKVTVVMADSHVTPLCGTTSGSKQTLITGGATHRGGTELKMRVFKGAAELLEAAPDDLDIKNGTIFVRGATGRAVGMGEAIKKCKEMDIPLHITTKIELGEHEYEGHENYGAPGGWMDYVFGIHAAEVEVNIDTGEVRLLNYWAGHDVGQVINPQHVEGQVEGGTMMGIGHGLVEEIQTKKGRITTNHFESYLILTAAEMPEWETIIEESGEGLGPYGAKGIGEPPCTAGAAAVACAVSQAIGARITRIPVTPDHVLGVLGKL
jgi:CO/xanthine dehydrogenase Mo-binding subunit